MDAQREEGVQPKRLDLKSLYDERARQAKERDPWLHPLCRPLDLDRKGPLLALTDGSLLVADAQGLAVSLDDGKTWSATMPAAHGQDPTEPASCALLETAPGNLVMVFLEIASPAKKFNWNAETGEPGEGCRLELQAIRSLDGGQTWSDRQCLLDGYNANFFGFIRTRRGRLVAVAEHLIANPGRWVVCSLISDDEGKSWQRSNLIDLGGHGHHDGAIEPTVVELSDGRLMMLIRTNLGFFWKAFSEDEGRYWRTLMPSQLDASSSPGQLLRLQSGRLILVWNRRNPEDLVWPLTPLEQHAEVAASWHREELSIAFSENDGRSWSRPLVIARQRGGQLSYPQALERRAGELWVIAGFASRKWFNEEPVRCGLKLREAELVAASA